ncbi:hypothetical protein IKE88_01790 [Candidatus Saccharibacteria bacterium]|nr:hypothetical protein [Candidatus Saccharibacteria bacterium]
MKSRRIIFTLLILACSIIGGGIIGRNVFARETWNGYGGPGSDQTGGSGGNGSGSRCSGNSCNSIIHSSATGWVAVPVTSPNMPIYSPGVSYGSTYVESSTYYTGNAAVGSTFYMHAMFATRDGMIRDGNGNVRYVKAGDVVSYIPMNGIIDKNGKLDTAWAASFLGGHSKGLYGIPESQVMAVYDQMVARGMIKDARDIAAFMMTGFGGLLDGAEELSDAELALLLEELIKMLCEAGQCELNPPGSGEPLPSCNEGSHAGWAEGNAYVKNMTKGESWMQGGTTWARPGDTVRFKIDYCWGVGAVGGSLGNPSSPWAIYPGGAATHEFGTVDEVWFAISAVRSEKYLFGEHERAISGGSNNKKNLLTNPHMDTIGATGVDFSNSDVEKTGNYAFLVLSPSSKDEGTYNCQIFDFSPYWVPFGYQVPGVATGGCGAISNNGGNMSDVGYSLSQTIRYNYATAWQMWKHEETGVCISQCTHDPEGAVPYIDGKQVRNLDDLNKLDENNSNAYPDKFPSLQAARSTPGKWGLIWKHKNDTALHLKDCDLPACSCAWYHWEPQGCWRCLEWDTCHTCDDNGDCHEYTCCASGEHYGCNQKCSCGKDECHKIGAKPVYPVYNYETAMQDLGERSSTATVNVPYSYRTSTESYINADDIIYLGEDVQSSFTVDILPRIVSEVRSDEAYATIVDGEIRAVEFIVSADSGPNVTGGPRVDVDPCTYYQGKMTVISPGCNTIWSLSGGLNEEGRYGGKTYHDTERRVVPDLERYPVGSKYCVAVGISTTDSHSNYGPDDMTVSGMSSPSGWRVSNASCRTIAKKPTFQVWNGGLYTNGNIYTSTTKKNVGVDLGGDPNPNRLFGSWDEYHVVAAGEVVNFASGAATGYAGVPSLGLPGGVAPDTSYCDRSKKTIANDQCGGYVTGKSGINTSMDTTIERLYSRYTMDTTGQGISFLDNGAVYVYSDGDLRTSQINKTGGPQLDREEKRGAMNEAVNFSNNYILKRKGKIDDASTQTTSNYASNALVIYVKGNLTIDTNICYGDGNCINNAGNTESTGAWSGWVTTQDWRLGARNSGYFTNIYSLPQVILIVDGNVEVDRNVDQIDAWIITRGVIDTCAPFSVGTSGADLCTKTLVFNGPVIADRLALNRSAGADPGAGRPDDNGNVLNRNIANDGSIAPGEIFNFRTDSLYWAYSQAQRFSQANVTYTRELAPRY